MLTAKMVSFSLFCGFWSAVPSHSQQSSWLDIPLSIWLSFPLLSFHYFIIVFFYLSLSLICLVINVPRVQLFDWRLQSNWAVLKPEVQLLSSNDVTRTFCCSARDFWDTFKITGSCLILLKKNFFFEYIYQSDNNSWRFLKKKTASKFLLMFQRYGE